MVTVCPSQFATRRTLFHVLVGCGLLMLKVSRLKLPVIWLLVSMWLNTLTKSRSEERFSRNAETDLVCRLLLEKKKITELAQLDSFVKEQLPLSRLFFFNDTATTEIYTLSLHDALPICYTQDAFSRSGWLWPVDAKGEPLKATSYMAVGFYVAKYVNKKSDMDLAAKGLGAKEWNNSLKTKLSLLPKKLFRIRMSR